MQKPFSLIFNLSGERSFTALKSVKTTYNESLLLPKEFDNFSILVLKKTKIQFFNAMNLDEAIVTFGK